MDRSGQREERLSALRDRGRPDLAPIWVEDLDPLAALDEVRRWDGAFFRLEEARLLMELGRATEAAAVLAKAGDLPPGLASMRQRVRSQISESAASSAPPASAEKRPPIVTKTVAELYASQGDAATAISMYKEILTRAPGDQEARKRLAQLLGETPGYKEELSAWLNRVKLWRSALGV